jgi:predicted RNA binding protein YcfA (HicA-like mRNA interferase family)
MAPRLPAVRPRNVLRALERAGFVLHHTTGSHYILKKPGAPALRVTVPFHRADLKPGTLRSIIDQSGLTLDEFIALL